MHEFGSIVLVELVGVDEYEEVATETIEFDRADPTERTVEPRKELPEEHVQWICDELSEHGYSLD